MSKSATIKQFAKEINVSEKMAYGMARCEEFRTHKISFDIRAKEPGRKNAVWRIDIERYYAVRDAGYI